MFTQRYWVIGGRYADTSWNALSDASPTVAGPFDDESEAKARWRELSAETSSLASTRFSVVLETVRLCA
jgi:hypothetical protein